LFIIIIIIISIIIIIIIIITRLLETNKKCTCTWPAIGQARLPDDDDYGASIQVISPTHSPAEIFTNGMSHPILPLLPAVEHRRTLPGTHFSSNRG